MGSKILQVSSLRMLFWLTPLIFLSASCTKQSVDPYVFRVSLWANEQHTWFKAFEYFEEILEERTNGQIKIEVYPSGTIGQRD